MPESSALFRDAPISSLICRRSDPAPRLFRCIQINRIANLRPCALSVAIIIYYHKNIFQAGRRHCFGQLLFTISVPVSHQSGITKKLPI
jgi:hypothetical protein